MEVIAISGKAGHGKDTTAIFMKQFLEANGSRVLITHYADLLKFMCKSYFGWNGEKDEQGRTLLQHVGTDIIRASNPDFITDFLVSALKMFGDQWDYVLIPDVRMPNELSCLRNAGFTVTYVRVIRPDYRSTLTAEQQCHYTETAMDNIRPDAIICNNRDLPYLCGEVGKWVWGCRGR